MALAALVQALRVTDLSALMTAAGLSQAAGGELGRTVWFLMWALVCAIALGGGEGRPLLSGSQAKKKGQARRA